MPLTAASVRSELRQLSNLAGINSWDLVDSSAPKLLGQWLLDHPRDVMDDLANSGELWKERIAILTCFPLIKNGQFREIKRLAKQFLNHEHDLIHKAVGWMLREMGNQDEAELCKFLDRHGNKMPRTMLRYSIERLSKQQRQSYMAM